MILGLRRSTAASTHRKTLMQPLFTHISPPLPAAPPSPMQLADRLLTLAQDADRAGHPRAAVQMLALVDIVLDGGQARRSRKH